MPKAFLKQTLNICDMRNMLFGDGVIRTNKWPVIIFGKGRQSLTIQEKKKVSSPEDLPVLLKCSATESEQIKVLRFTRT